MAGSDQGLVTPPVVDSQDIKKLKPYSCLLCRHRKVKCSRTDPCDVCLRSKATCEYVAPAPPRRRSAAPAKEGLHARLRRYERILSDYSKKLGTPISQSPERGSEDGDTEVLNGSPSRMADGPPRLKRAKLVSRKDSSRYLDSEMWTALTKELDDPRELFSDDSAEGIMDRPIDAVSLDAMDEYALLFNSGQHQSLDTFHPGKVILNRLWHAFVENVDPVTKIVHVPSLQKTIDKVLNQEGQLSKSDEALLFTIYLLAVTSWSDEQCLQNLGEAKLSALRRYRALAQQALLNASLLKTTNVVTLQSYVLFMMTSRQLRDTSTLLSLSAVALRIARRIGLHRDGTFLRLPPFETEMRRRLWWFIVMIDFKLAQLCGSRPSEDHKSDTKLPLNLCDSDLYPGMTEPPKERSGITEMVFVLARNYAMEGATSIIVPGATSDSKSSIEDAYAVSERDAIVNRVQDTYEQKIHRYCDPLQPIHVLASVMCRSVVCKLRISAHNPFRFADQGVPMPRTSRDIVWDNGRKLIDYAVLMKTSPVLSRYGWMLGSHFMWDSYIYTLVEMRRRSNEPDVEIVWKQIGELFRMYPQPVMEPNNPIFMAVGIWTLRVWDHCATTRVAGSSPAEEPDFIRLFRNAKSDSSSGLMHTPESDVVSGDFLAKKAQTMYGQIRGEYFAPPQTNNSVKDFDDMLYVPSEGLDWAQFDQLFQ